MLRLIGDLLESLKARPLGRQIVLEFYAIAGVAAERCLLRQLIYDSGIGGIELAYLEAVLEIRLTLGETNEKILESDFASGPVAPQMIGNRAR